MIYKEIDKEGITWVLNWKEKDNKVYYKYYRLDPKGIKM